MTPVRRRGYTWAVSGANDCGGGDIPGQDLVLLGRGRVLLAGGDVPGWDPALLERSRVLLAGGDVLLRDLALLERGRVLPGWGGCSRAGFELGLGLMSGTAILCQHNR